MRFVSQLFQPLLIIPKNAKVKNTEITCKSQKLLLECGLIRPTSPGFFALLPLARRALDKLEALVKQHIEAAGGQRVSLPALTAARLWEKTGRITEELLKVQDRHGKKFVLAPTHEEAIADLLADVGPVSYKQLPLLLYQISDKYRDELRPKHGVLRARSFRMLDAYGAHTLDQATEVYQRVGDQYGRLFDTLRLDVHRVAAPCGEMGGSESHEWQVPAPAGEDHVAVCAGCGQPGGTTGSECQCGGRTESVNSIEVGHTFILGTRYSEALGANYVVPSGPPQPIVMSCYGIGITRLLAASLEALSTDTALRWPEPIAPYRAILIGPKEGSKEWSVYNSEQMLGLFDKLSSLPGLRNDIIFDDRHQMTVGKRILMADKMGYPLVIVCGKGVLETPPRLELHSRGETQLLTLGQLMWALQDGNEKVANKM
ncbi:probable proline--tRNA ligase, mitochondrial [Cydia pomonella]|uniref:probable proline--tRNA ligase, mitochondrial n=1 Tax=Cydia pomonella TaxID=82600 RepID=UPI002ADD6117|nr:probable proline--tRNA ligase, mitochondrial [Cydia pomonella]